MKSDLKSSSAEKFVESNLISNFFVNTAVQSSGVRRNGADRFEFLEGFDLCRRNHDRGAENVVSHVNTVSG